MGGVRASGWGAAGRSVGRLERPRGRRAGVGSLHSRKWWQALQKTAPGSFCPPQFAHLVTVWSCRSYPYSSAASSDIITQKKVK